MLWGVLVVCFGYGARAGLRGASPDSIGSYPLQVSVRFTTNLIFRYRIAQVDIGSGDVMGRKMGKAENVLLLKAARAGFSATNVSVYLEDGRLYSFLVSYSDSLGVFNLSFAADSVRRGAVEGGAGLLRARLSGWPAPRDSMEADARKVVDARACLYVRACSDQLELRLWGAYLRDSVLWLAFRARNYSKIGFRPGRMRFFVEDRRKVRRTASQTVEWTPVYDGAPASVTGEQAWAVGFVPKALPRGKRLVVVWSGSDDGRTVRLVVKGRHILRARVL